MLRCIIFDLDGVLVDSTDATTSYIRNVFLATNINPPTATQIETLLSSTLDGLLRTFLESEQQRQAVLDQIQKTPYPVELVKIHDQTRPICQRLKEKYKIAIVTSRIRRDTDRIVQELGVDFDLVLTSGDYDKPKPDPEPLLRACEILSVRAEMSVYVGDAVSDYEAAKAAGMNYIHVAGLGAEVAGLDIRSVVEIETAIDRLQAD